MSSDARTSCELIKAQERPKSRFGLPAILALRLRRGVQGDLHWLRDHPEWSNVRTRARDAGGRRGDLARLRAGHERESERLVHCGREDNALHNFQNSRRASITVAFRRGGLRSTRVTAGSANITGCMDAMRSPPRFPRSNGQPAALGVGILHLLIANCSLGTGQQ